jgi:hypothetical protein
MYLCCMLGGSEHDPQPRTWPTSVHVTTSRTQVHVRLRTAASVAPWAPTVLTSDDLLAGDRAPPHPYPPRPTPTCPTAPPPRAAPAPEGPPPPLPAPTNLRQSPTCPTTPGPLAVGPTTVSGLRFT